MNALRPLFVNARSPLRLLARAGAGVGACALLGGCVGNPFDTAKVDPASPVAADVARAARANRDYPSFREIPALPSDMRPLRAFGQEVAELKTIRARLERETAPETWTLQDTEGFAAGALRQAPEIEPSERAQDPEAYARELRERATPPPPRQ